MFAYSLLCHAKRNVPDIGHDSSMRSDCDDTSNDTAESSIASEVNGNTQNDITGQHIWSRAETLLLIDIYKTHEEQFNNPKITGKRCWNLVAEKMKEKGYNIAADKCDIKFQSLKRTYKSISDHNKKSGQNRKKWEFYEIMDEIFRTKPYMQPLATAGSTVTNVDVAGCSKDSNCPDKENINTSGKKSGTSINIYFG